MKTSPIVAAVAAMFASMPFLTPTTARAQLPHKAAPDGMREVSAGGSGRILTARLSGTSSARKMLAALKAKSRGYFDGPITITRAYADADDKKMQASFTARLKGVPVHGVASVSVAGGQGTLLFDNAGSFSNSFHALVAKAGSGGGHAGGGAARPVTLTRQTAPDGSCQISLPPGYRITGAYQGTLDVVGPHGSQMGLGGPVLCTRPEAAAFFPGIPPVDFGDPAQAMVDYVRYSGAKNGKTITVKVFDVKPIPDWPTGRAAFVRYSTRMDGRTDEEFGLFAIAPTDVNQAMLYVSYIEASEATYRQEFPGMLRAWGSWSVNPSVFTQRLMAAAQSMRGMDDIIISSNAYHEKVNDQVSEAWSDVFRDQGTWENPETGNRYKLPNSFTNLGTPTQDGVELNAVPLGDL